MRSVSLPLLAAALLAAGACGEPLDLSGRWKGTWQGIGGEVHLTLDLAHDLQSDGLSGSWEISRWWSSPIPIKSSGTLEGSLSEGGAVSIDLIRSSRPDRSYGYSGTVVDEGMSIIGALINDYWGEEWPIELSREGS